MTSLWPNPPPPSGRGDVRIFRRENPVLCGRVKGCLPPPTGTAAFARCLQGNAGRIQRCAHVYKSFNSHPPVSRSVVQNGFGAATQRRAVLWLWQHWPGEIETLPKGRNQNLSEIMRQSLLLASRLRNSSDTSARRDSSTRESMNTAHSSPPTLS